MEILKSILHSNWAPAIATILVALIAGSFALAQVRHNNIISSRIKWLETLKQNISDFIAGGNDFIIKVGQHHFKSDSGPDTSWAVDKEITFLMKESYKQLSLIFLNLNPRNTAHTYLQKLLTNFDSYLAQLTEKYDETIYDKLRDEQFKIIEVSQYIFTREFIFLHRGLFYWNKRRKIEKAIRKYIEEQDKLG